MKSLICRLTLAIFVFLFMVCVEATELQFSGSGNFEITDTTITVKANSLTNVGNNTSGTLFLKLYAMTDNDPYGSGYILAEGNLATFIGNSNNGTLAPGQSYTNIQFSTSFTPPPDGNYYLFLHVSEYPNLNSSLAYMEAVSNPHTFNYSGTGGGGNSGDLDLNCPCSYAFSGTSLTLSATQVSNHSSNVTSGTLKLQLWATTTPYTGGNINGYQLGEVSLGQLGTNTFYADIEQNTNFTPPPDGTYYITMLLTEFNGNDVIVDYTTFNETRTFSAAGGDSGTGNGELNLSCPCSYNIDNASLSLSVSAVTNNRSGGTSGTLRLKLWATSTRYAGGQITGYELGQLTLGTLEGGFGFNSLENTTAFKSPPDGTYYITLTLTEYKNSDYIVDYINFDETRTFTDSTSGENKGQSGAISLSCPCGYQIDGSVLSLSASQVLNGRNGGSSGTLKLKLWASSSRYTGGAISGYILGEVNLGELDGGHYYSDIERNTTLRKPPDGAYFITMTLTEYNGEDVIIDYISFDSTQSFTTNTSPPPIIGAGADAGGGSISWLMLLMLFSILLIKLRRK
tara:strand:- start:2044 stop:3750 length:1707 start_codon:yes stop_codon:yes gene_type:complete